LIKEVICSSIERLIFKRSDNDVIEKINISDYGSFKDYSWTPNSIFKHRNILYGRNYSGKTTLSRIFRTLDKEEHHPDVPEGKFELITSGGFVTNQSNIHDNELNVKVYNTDFVRENLSVFYADDGNVQGFTVLGEKNIQLEKEIGKAKKEIKELDEEIGDIDEKNSILGRIRHKEQQIEKEEKFKTASLREKAGNIYRNENLFKFSEQQKTYNITDIRKEIEKAYSLTSEKKDLYHFTLLDDVKSSLSHNLKSIENFDLKGLVKKIYHLLNKQIEPQELIQELSDDKELAKWVRDGIDLHKGKRDTCAFCQNGLVEVLWKRLNKHFTEEADKFRNEIGVYKEKIRDFIITWRKVTLLDKGKFYTVLHNRYDKLKKEFLLIKDDILEELVFIANRLESRKDDIYSGINIKKKRINKLAKDFLVLVASYKNLIDDHNNHTDNLEVKQNRARRALRLDSINTFLQEIQYETILRDIKLKKASLKEKKIRLENREGKKVNLKKKISEWEAEIKDERRAAQLIDTYLQDYLGHPELSIDVEDNNEKITFKIKRNNKRAKNLSEGEQRLIGFCYFLAKLKSISNPEDYIIFVDDPISSLDTNNLFYIYSLIDTELSQVPYKQLFISTHSLDLLAYFHRIGFPKNGEWKKRFFMIERQGSVEEKFYSRIMDMPKFLQKYATEFTYLFQEIHRVANENPNDENHHIFYNFGNNARKFLEIYLFFKYPHHNLTDIKRLTLFFENDLNDVSFINRINNEFSHTEKHTQRVIKPLDFPELKKEANLILSRMKKTDGEQYKYLCKSIGVAY